MGGGGCPFFQPSAKSPRALGKNLSLYARAPWPGHKKKFWPPAADGGKRSFLQKAGKTDRRPEQILPNPRDLKCFFAPPVRFQAFCPKSAFFAPRAPGRNFSLYTQASGRGGRKFLPPGGARGGGQKGTCLTKSWKNTPNPSGFGLFVRAPSPFFQPSAKNVPFFSPRPPRSNLSWDTRAPLGGVPGYTEILGCRGPGGTKKNVLGQQLEKRTVGLKKHPEITWIWGVFQAPCPFSSFWTKMGPFCPPGPRSNFSLYPRAPQARGLGAKRHVGLPGEPGGRPKRHVFGNKNN